MDRVITWERRGDDGGLMRMGVQVDLTKVAMGRVSDIISLELYIDIYRYAGATLDEEDERLER